jgi:hypothetical protein
MEPHHWMILIGFLSIEVTIVLALVRFRVGIERRLGEAMTRREHEAICEKREANFMAHFKKIEEKIDQNETRSADTRHAIRDTVQVLTTKVELVRQQVAYLTTGRLPPPINGD